MHDDDAGPVESVEPGMSVSVMPRGGAGPGRDSGILAASRGFSIYVRTGDQPWQPGDEVVIACGALGRRVAALARFRSYGDGQALFTRQSPWRPFNRRILDRYPVALNATFGPAAAAVPVTITDISAGGAAVQVKTIPSFTSGPLTISAGAARSALAATIVGGHAESGGIVLHLRFVDCNPESALVLGALLGDIISGMRFDAA